MRIHERQGIEVGLIMLKVVSVQSSPYQFPLSVHPLTRLWLKQDTAYSFDAYKSPAASAGGVPAGDEIAATLRKISPIPEL